MDRRVLAAGAGLLAAAGAAALGLAADGDGERTETARTDARTSAPAVAAVPPPRVVTRGCPQRVEGGRITADPRTDLVVGPFSVRGLPAGYRNALAGFRRGALDERAALKAIALLQPGARVTLAVPRAQRDWLQLAYEFPADGGRDAARLAACRHSSSAHERRAECEWAPRLACRSVATQFSGGVWLDFARAPRDGRCAALHVWVEDRPGPVRVRLFDPPRGACAGAPL